VGIGLKELSRRMTAMDVALTGATGFVGSHVLTELLEHGHEVTALVRDDAHVDTVRTRGAEAAVVDLYDRSAVMSLLNAADAAIHTASPGDTTSAALDAAVVDAAIDALGGTDKPYLQIGGAWVYGSNSSISEDSPFDSPPLVAWREPIERRVLGERGIRGAVIVAGTAYGDGGGGVPGVLLGSPRDDAGNLIMIGAGQQHWSTVPPLTSRTLSGESWKTSRLVAITSSTMACTRPLPSSRRSGSGPRFRRGGSRPLGRLLRRGPPARSEHRRGQGSSRPRLAPDSSGTC
jgi:NAD(P)-dependent dehydrogenase (short-subunit alcohol dehydrogenase family)